MELPLVYHPDYDVVVPEGHPFPMSKFRGVYEHLLTSGLARLEQFRSPDPVTRAQIEQVHDADFVTSYLTGEIGAKEMRRIGFPWNEAIVRRTVRAAGGTLLTARLAFQHGIAANTAGGTHHAFPDFGSGFCIFNDLAIAIRTLQVEGAIEKALVVDLDVHQGDGTAVVFENDPTVFTFSMHGATNFPRIKRRSDLDVALPDATGDEEYLAALRGRLPTILANFDPDLVLYDAGVDPHHSDRFGKLALSDEGLEERDRYVIDTCRDLGFPVACVIGGGYHRDIERLVRRHSILHRVATERFRAEHSIDAATSASSGSP